MKKLREKNKVENKVEKKSIKNNNKWFTKFILWVSKTFMQLLYYLLIGGLSVLVVYTSMTMVLPPVSGFLYTHAGITSAFGNVLKGNAEHIAKVTFWYGPYLLFILLIFKLDCVIIYNIRKKLIEGFEKQFETVYLEKLKLIDERIDN